MDDEEDELIQFIQNHQDDFYRFCYSYVKDSSITMDIVQDAIVKAIENNRKLRKREYMKTWFYRILINECKLYLRKKKIMEPFGDRTYVKEELHPNIVLEVQEIVQQLPPKYRDIIYLRYYEDMTITEISEVLNVNVNSVKTRLYKALDLLKLSWKDGSE